MEALSAVDRGSWFARSTPRCEIDRNGKGEWRSTARILTSGYALDPSIVPSSTTYLDKPWSLNDLVMAVANLLQPDRPLEKH